MKKILFVIGSLQIGGAEMVLVDLLNSLNLSSEEIDLLLIENRGELIERLNPKITLKSLSKSDKDCDNFLVYFFNKLYRSFIYRFLSNSKLYARYVYKNILKKKYDTEVAFLMGAPAKLIKNSPYNNSKKILWIHADVTSISKKSQKEYYKLYNSYNVIVAPSQKSFESFTKTFPNCNVKILTIHNYINTEKIKKLSLESNHVFDTKKNKHILAVGRLVPDKCYERLIKAVYLLNKEFNDYDVNIIGDGSEKGKLENMCQDLKIDNINFLGTKTNPYPYFREADIYVLSSQNEAYPTAVIEALILNKLIVATNVPGVQEILKDYKKGFIVEKTDEDLYLGLKKAYKLIGENIRVDTNFESENQKNLIKIEDLIVGKEEKNEK